MVLTVDKGVAMVVLDKEEYIQKVENLLAQSGYKTTERDPTNRIKAKLIQILRRIKRETGMEEGMCKVMYPTGCNPQVFMGYQKSINLVSPLGLLYLAGAQSHVVWLKSLLRYSNHW